MCTQQAVLRAAVRLEPCQDTFSDGANILLSAYYMQRFELLRFLLGDKFVNFWRFSHLSLLFWAILGDHSCQVEDETLISVVTMALQSKVMTTAFTQLFAHEKIAFVNSLFDLTQGAWQARDTDLPVREILAQRPYSTSFICHMADRERYRDL